MDLNFDVLRDDIIRAFLVTKVRSSPDTGVFTGAEHALVPVGESDGG